MTAPEPAPTRLTWSDLPPRVRDGLEQVIGGRVIRATSQVGGFSPGTADRVRTEDGRRAFVKAVSPAQNARSAALARREADVAEALPVDVPAPRLLGRFDDGEWVALVLEDIEGRQPRRPWPAGELDRVIAALTTLAQRATPAPALPAPVASADAVAERLSGWHRIAADRPEDLDPWAARTLDGLRARSDRGIEAVTSGRTLLHTDLRADNLLLRADGAVSVVDWPWADVGAGWFDLLVLLVDVYQFGGHDGEDLLRCCEQVGDVQRDDLVAALAALAGFFTDNARRPAPQGVPTVRAFQRAQARAALGWLRATVEVG